MWSSKIALGLVTALAVIYFGALAADILAVYITNAMEKK